METLCQRHRRPTYFLCAISRASSFLVFPPEQSFFTLCKTPAPNFGIRTARDGNVTPAPQNFPPNNRSPQRPETSSRRGEESPSGATSSKLRCISLVKLT